MHSSLATEGLKYICARNYFPSVAPLGLKAALVYTPCNVPYTCFEGFPPLVCGFSSREGVFPLKKNTSCLAAFCKMKTQKAFPPGLPESCDPCRNTSATLDASLCSSGGGGIQHKWLPPSQVPSCTPSPTPPSPRTL